MELAGYTVSDAIPLPAKTDYGIGIIGCGGIVNYAHLPAYTSARFRVLACYDRDPEAAQRTARDHGIPRVAASIAELVAEPSIDIIDVAITPWDQPAVAAQAIAAGKHFLARNLSPPTTPPPSTSSPWRGNEASSSPSTSSCAGTPGSPSPSN